ncbi:hypothetical protein HanHA300_Chr12g0432011 [Helianthus annuus]|nr:hypothetical protein HanHA300_Chr12g0432011 [Helianthus annuus]KAJ0491839.1 hypothetical protein HanIR_Chr12g0568201 [Helianthus annuus]KAJ0504200.1 hypothetical protein HanHA89_Chr12g0456651 [Helianthus annuus]KAJ0673905.1 hypothetical protein HanLR1_Chr12g0434101 [Helianthus annuus]KAJ0861540.1 hypothetical protein HanPSC8_Chr12g0507831 [Helianthus annuus]
MKNSSECMGKEHFHMENYQQKWPGGNQRVLQKEGISYADLFKGRGNTKGEFSSISDSFIDKTISVPEEVSAFRFLHGSALVGRSVDINSLNKMDSLLWEGGFGGVIHYVGGLLLLLSFKDHEAAAEFLLKQEVWKKWFSALDLWEGQTLAFERVAWLNVFGVPLHLADNSVFNDIGRQFGTVVKPAQLSIDDDDLSMACVGVLVGDGKAIKEVVNLKWKDKSYQVWVSEVNDVWIPECMGVVGLKNNVSTEESTHQSSEFSPVVGGSGKVAGSDKSMEDEEAEQQAGLHGNFNHHSVINNMEVGPEVSNQVERESGCFLCTSHEPGKKKEEKV